MEENTHISESIGEVFGSSSKHKNKKGVMIKRIIIGTITIIIISIIVGAIARQIDWKKSEVATNFENKIASVTTTSPQAEEKKILAHLKKHMIVPEESPTFFTIVDAATLAREQSFFVGSVNGDVLVTFGQAQKAVIYSPSRDIVVNAGPIVANVDKSAAAKTTTKKK